MNKNFLLLALLALPCVMHGMDDGDSKRRHANISIAAELGIAPSQEDARAARKHALDQDVKETIDKIQTKDSWKTNTGTIVEKGMEDAIRERVKREMLHSPEEIARERALSDIAYGKTMAQHGPELALPQGEMEARIAVARDNYLRQHGQSIAEQGKEKAELFIAQQEYLDAHGQSPEAQGIREAQAAIAKKNYQRQHRAPISHTIGDAVQEGIFGGVSQGVATVVASAIIVMVSKPFGFIWDKTCSCYSYIKLPKSEKATLTRMTNLTNDAVKLQTDLELKKLEIRMAQNKFTLIEKEKELKALKDQLQAIEDKEREKAVKEFLASKPKDMPFAANTDFAAQSTQGAAPAA